MFHLLLITSQGCKPVYDYRETNKYARKGTIFFFLLQIIVSFECSTCALKHISAIKSLQNMLNYVSFCMRMAEFCVKVL